MHAKRGQMNQGLLKKDRMKRLGLTEHNGVVNRYM